MEDQEIQKSPIISDESQEKVRAAIGEIFSSLPAHFKQIADDIEEFNQRRRELQGNIGHGVRRTNSRIV